MANQVAELVSNPLSVPDSVPVQVMNDVATTREAQEVQAMMVVAKRYPRDTKKAVDNILAACTRPTLAESALYQYNRGGTDVTGPSIRLAEAIVQAWGNMQVGIRELEQRNGESTVEAFAWDMETNIRQVKIFQVPHVRHTKKGSYRLEDPRDIYEMVANQGARRLRACILNSIPGDIIESAVEQCEATLKTKADVTPERLQNLVSKFADLGVTKEQLEKRIQRRIDSMTPALMVNLGKVYNSIKDGMSSASDWFEPVIGEAAPAEVKITAAEKIKEVIKKGNKGSGSAKGIAEYQQVITDYGDVNKWESRPDMVTKCIESGHSRIESKTETGTIVGCPDCNYQYFVPFNI